jgi:hypothetical protein
VSFSEIFQLQLNQQKEEMVKEQYAVRRVFIQRGWLEDLSAERFTSLAEVQSCLRKGPPGN